MNELPKNMIPQISHAVKAISNISPLMLKKFHALNQIIQTKFDRFRRKSFEHRTGAPEFSLGRLRSQNIRRLFKIPI
jgi:hypothetical protein